MYEKWKPTREKSDFSADQAVQDEQAGWTFSQRVFYQTSWIHWKHKKYEQHKRYSLGLELRSTMVISYDNVSLKQHVTKAIVF